MQEVIKKYLPEAAVVPVLELLERNRVHLKIVSQRVSRHGDYRNLPDGSHRITVNANLNKYRFLITLLHEIAHLLAFEEYGRSIKPHGREWKRTFQLLILPYLRPEVFPGQLLPLLALHFKNPRATSDTDTRLSLALKAFDPPNGKNYIFEVPHGSLFRLYNGQIFRRGDKRVKRFECVEIASGRIYLFNPTAEVELINEQHEG